MGETAEEGGVNQCKNCAHWVDGHLSIEERGLGLRKCMKTRELWRCTDWIKDYSEFGLKDAHKDDLAFTQDGSSYMAELLTMPDFGCVQFTPTDPQSQRQSDCNSE